jgi:hypothetical protein
MKCPKCGFNSFEFLDSCKKCGVSLASFKKSLGVSPVVFASGRLQMETKQPRPADVPLEEASLPAAPLVQQDEDNEETFSWDIPPLSETAPETDTAFSGFDLDFMKDTGKPVEPESDFSFDEEPVTESPEVSKTETADSFEEFSFYENTLDPGEVPISAEDAEGPSGNDPFGETGVIGEILPEQLQAGGQELELSDLIDDSSPEAGRFENESVFEDLSGEAESAGNKDKETKKDPPDISDFEKEFESIFQTDDAPDNGKTGS